MAVDFTLGVSLRSAPGTSHPSAYGGGFELFGDLADTAVVRHRSLAPPPGVSLTLQPTIIDGTYIVMSGQQKDIRGSFSRVWCADVATQFELPSELKQCSLATNDQPFTLRGMHYQQSPGQEAKWVRCVQGAIWDVVVDLRPASPTYKKWEAFELTPENGRGLFIPPQCAHGYLTLKPNSSVFYAMNVAFEPKWAAGFHYQDPQFAIEWPHPPRVIGARDQNYANFEETQTS